MVLRLLALFAFLGPAGSQPAVAPTIANYYMQPCPQPGCPGSTVGAAGSQCTPDQSEKCASAFCAWDRTRASYRCAAYVADSSSGFGCMDSLMNGWETDLNCGGECSGCKDSYPCFSGADCRSSVCTFGDAYQTTVLKGLLLGPGGTCTPPTCFDAVANGLSSTKLEPDIDCGAPCCVGSPNPRQCPSLCRAGWQCNTKDDCASARCFKNVMEGGTRYCAPQRVDETRPQFGSRFQSGFTIMGPRKLGSDPAPLFASIAFLLDVSLFQVLEDALVDVQRAREYGNYSYSDLRYEKGWAPGHSYVRRRRAQEVLEASRGSVPPHVIRGRKRTAVESDIGPSAKLEFAFGSGREAGGVTEFEAGLRRRYGEAGLGRYRERLSYLASASAHGIPWTDVGGGVGPDDLVPPSPHGRTQAGAARSAQQLFVPVSYNLTTTDTVIGLSTRYVVYAEPCEVEMLAARATNMLSLQVLPGGWAAERELQGMLDRLAEDRTFCLKWAVNYTIGGFNTSGVDCTLWAALDGTNFTLPGQVGGGNDNATNAVNETNEGNGTTAPGRRQLRSAWNAFHDLVLTSPLDSSWLRHHAVFPALIAHVKAVCGYTGPCAREDLLTPSMAHTEAPSLATTGARRRAQDFVSPPSASAAGAALLPGIPRVGLGDMLTFFGLPWDSSYAGGGLRSLKLGAGTIDKAPPSQGPSTYYRATSIAAVQSPHGTPEVPLYDSVIFPVQPIVTLMDRHGRRVTAFASDLRVTALLDPSTYPLTGLTLLSGFVAPTIAGTGGLAVYDDLQISAPIPGGVVINFTATFVTAQQARILITGSTRPFVVYPLPPKPIIIYVRTPLAPLLVGIFLALGFVAIGATAYGGPKCGERWYTPGRRAEMAQARAVYSDQPELSMEVAYYRPRVGGEHAEVEVEVEEEELVAAPIVSAPEEDEEEPPPPRLGEHFDRAFAGLEAALDDFDDEGEEEEEEEEGAVGMRNAAMSLTESRAAVAAMLRARGLIVDDASGEEEGSTGPMLGEERSTELPGTVGSGSDSENY